MELLVKNIIRDKKIRSFSLLLLLLLFSRIMLSSVNSFWTTILSELILFCILILTGLYLYNPIEKRKTEAVSLIMNVAVLNAAVYFLLSFSSNLFDFWHVEVRAFLVNPDIFAYVVSMIILVAIAIIYVYTFQVFRCFYFLGERKKDPLYFNLMLIFFIIASFANSISAYFGADYIKKAFIVSSILLILFNSIKISWIAFLSKKEKKQLLLISVISIILFILNLHSLMDRNQFVEFIKGSSPAIYQFMFLVMIYGCVYFGILFFTTLFHLPTAEAFDRKATEITSLQNLSALITRVFDLNELADTVTELALKVAGANSAWIVWKNPKHLNPASARNITFTDSIIITEIVEAFNLKTPINSAVILNISKDKKTSGLSEKFQYVLASPLKAQNTIKGFLIIAKKKNSAFDEEDKSAVNTFSEYVSLAIENSELVEKSIEKERLERELEVAREMQQKLLPQAAPQIGKVQISSVFIPAFEVGGDYYDFFRINDDNLGFIIADVSGKGISAAFIMAEIKGIFESLSGILTRPKDILIEANRILQKSLNRKSFVSALYGIVNQQSGILSICRAGHTPAIMLREGKINELKPSGIGLGLDFSDNFGLSLEEIQIKLQHNDTIVLYTDGITEAENSEMEEFGNTRLEEVVLQHKDDKTDDISQSIISEVTMFSQNNHQHDDITLLILRWKENKILDGDK